MTKQKREINFLAPLVIMGVAWAIKKSAEKSQNALAKKRPSGKAKPQHEDFVWKVGLGVALAGAEALISRLMTKESEPSADKPANRTD
jgi:hypothetical protein